MPDIRYHTLEFTPAERRALLDATQDAAASAPGYGPLAIAVSKLEDDDDGTAVKAIRGALVQLGKHDGDPMGPALDPVRRTLQTALVDLGVEARPC